MGTVCPTPRGSAAGGTPAASEFYVPLIAIGEQRRAEPGACRARQLQPLVRQPRPRVTLMNDDEVSGALPRGMQREWPRRLL